MIVKSYVTEANDGVMKILDMQPNFMQNIIFDIGSIAD